jgi:hypothetical protein
MFSEFISYEALTTIVVINALATVALWRQVSGKVSRPLGLNKKAEKALWRSDPIVPKHTPPKAAGASVPSLVDDEDRRFFEEFKEFADVVNWWLSDEFINSSFRLQDLPDDDMSLNVSYDYGPIFGRRFALYFNQMDIGRLEIYPSTGYATDHPVVNTSVEITVPRLLGFGQLTEFLRAIAMHVTRGEAGSAYPLSAEFSIQFGLTETLWGNYRISEFDRQFGEVEDWGELNVSFHGVAEFYKQRKNAPAFRDETAK